MLRFPSSSRVTLPRTSPCSEPRGNMKRRDFIALLGAAAWPLPTRSQSRILRIGALVIGNADVPGFQKELRAGLRELSRVEGRDYAIELRSAEGQLGRLPELAAEL